MLHVLGNRRNWQMDEGFELWWRFSAKDHSTESEGTTGSPNVQQPNVLCDI